MRQTRCPLRGCSWIAPPLSSRRSRSTDMRSSATRRGTRRDARRSARRECWKTLKVYRARNPHWGWASFVLLGAALGAAVAGAISAGSQIDLADAGPVITVLSVMAGIGAFVVAVGSRGLPQNRGFMRPLLVIAVGLTAAAGFHLSRGVTPTSLIIAVSALCGVGALIGHRVARWRHPDETVEIDSAITAALIRMQPEVDATGDRLQAEVLAQLSAEEEALIRGHRAGPSHALGFSEVPAGGVIIRVLLATWIPEVMREDIRKAP